MANSKGLYFIPIIVRAIGSDDPLRAMRQAFQEIQELGKQPEYEEGFRQFRKLVQAGLEPSGDDYEERTRQLMEAVYRLIYDFATGTFPGDEEQRKALKDALASHPEWNAEYERIRKEAHSFLAPDALVDIEVLREDQVIGSWPVSETSICQRSVNPGSYTVRLSNGRILWQGDLTREDVIWAFAYPEKDLPMAAETEPQGQEPTRRMSRLGGELTIYVFAGLESGEIMVKNEQSKS